MIRATYEPGIDLVVRLRAANAREREPVTDLDTLHRLDAHQRKGELSVEPVGLLGIRAEAGRATVDDDLDDPTQGVAILSCRIRRLAHALVTRRAADLERSSGYGDSNRREESLGDGSGRDVCRGVPRTRPLQ